MASRIIQNPSLWQSLVAELTPPQFWDADQSVYVFGDGASDDAILYIGDDELPGELTWTYAIDSVPSGGGGIYFKYAFDAELGDQYETPIELDLDAGTGTIRIQVPPGTQSMIWQLSTNNVQTISVVSTGLNFQDGQVVIFGCDTSYNCDCEVDATARTLADMRTELLIGTGYSAQIANLPPGVEALYNGWLNRSQKYLYQKYKALQTERFFSWVLEPGVRYYGLYDNKNCCPVRLNRYRVTGAWIQDLNNVWWPLIAGIDPTFYTLDQNFGWPNFYEIRQCIEVFPAPQAAYTLWIKGHFDLLPFEEDDDLTTIDAEPVLNYATYLAKSHKGMPDANVHLNMAIDHVRSLIAGAHLTKRYIPGTAQVPIPTPPIMTHFES